jgi:hypothetical protein
MREGRGVNSQNKEQRINLTRLRLNWKTVNFSALWHCELFKRFFFLIINKSFQKSLATLLKYSLKHAWLTWKSPKLYCSTNIILIYFNDFWITRVLTWGVIASLRLNQFSAGQTEWRKAPFIFKIIFKHLYKKNYF